jgi:hypothetical protein
MDNVHYNNNHHGIDTKAFSRNRIVQIFNFPTKTAARRNNIIFFPTHITVTSTIYATGPKV